MLLTRLPLSGKSKSLFFHTLSKLAVLRNKSLGRFVRLACLRHAASVHPEPGSNSHKKYLLFKFNLATQFLDILLSFQRSFLQGLLTSALVIYQIFKLLSTLFLTFFKFDIYIFFCASLYIFFLSHDIDFIVLFNLCQYFFLTFY